MVLSTITKEYLALFRCHTAPDPSSYFGVVHPGQTHVKDLASLLADPQEPLFTSLSLFEMALDEWLPCFFSGK